MERSLLIREGARERARRARARLAEDGEDGHPPGGGVLFVPWGVFEPLVSQSEQPQPYVAARQGGGKVTLQWGSSTAGQGQEWGMGWAGVKAEGAEHPTSRALVQGSAAASRAHGQKSEGPNL